MASDTDSKKKKRKRDPKDEDSKGNAEPSIDSLQAKCEELETRLLRAQADFQNQRRRTQADLEAGLKRQLQPLLEELLLVLDFLEMALATPATNDETKNLAVGVEMTRTKLVQALENSGVQAIRTEGIFDPRLHDAAEAVEDDDKEPGTILATLRRGFTWQEHVLRPARVKVVAGEVPAPEPDEEGTEDDGEEDA